ncbi:hypothetical protein HY091_03455 [Candidatus Kaiserbacteria bacterium]|nr:hypothetical protein [Candidatus Kaiserbacteria bacterium]
MTLAAILVSLQALGAIVGVVGVMWGEMSYVRAMKDGAIDTAERIHLSHIARALRFGMMLLLLASLGLVVLAFSAHAPLQPAEQSAYWIEMLLALLIIFLSYALSRRKVSFALGSASIFSAWWFLALLAFGQLPSLTLGAAIALYLIATGILYGLLWYARMLAMPRS